MNTPKTSVLLPVYRGMPYLAEAVDSVLGQSMQDFELLIGDDGSDDGTREFLASLSDPRVRVVPPGDSRGLFPNLNRLLPLARGALIRLFCQDDVLADNALEQEARFFQRYPEIGMAFCKYQEILPDGRRQTRLPHRDLPNVLEPPLATQHFFYHGCIPGNLSTVTVRREEFEQGGGFDVSYRVSGDYERWSRLGVRRAVGVIHQPLVWLRTHPKRLSSAEGSQVAFVRENARIRSQLLPRLPAELQDFAQSYAIRRTRVLDWHSALRYLLRGKGGAAARVWRTFSFGQWLSAGMWWFLTLNNRLIRPQARWVVPSDYGARLEKDQAEDRAVG